MYCQYISFADILVRSNAACTVNFTMVSSNKFAALAPIVRDICRTSGIPGIALGVLHEGEVVYTAAYGFADVEKQLPCDEDTTFVLGSLTKAMTAALVSSLIHDGSLLS